MSLGEFNETGITNLIWISDHDQHYKKLPQRDAVYRKSTDASKVCGNCRYYVHPNSCQRVDGYIEEDFVCDLWAIDSPKISNVVSKFVSHLNQ